MIENGPANIFKENNKDARNNNKMTRMKERPHEFKENN